MQSRALKKIMFHQAPSKNSSFSDTLQVIEDEAKGQKVTIGEITEALNNRGFGSLLILPSIMTILPTGAIPGVPLLCASFIILTTGQMICGRHYPWMPRWMKNFSLERKKFIRGIDKIKPAAEVIDRYVSPRFDFFANDIMQRVIACFCFALALLMMVVGFVPFVPALISMPILFFAVGLTSRDGIMTLAGFAFTLAAVLLILNLAGFTGGEDKIHIKAPVFITQPVLKINLDAFH